MKKLYIKPIFILITILVSALSNKMLAQQIDVSGIPTTLCANESFTLSFDVTGGLLINSGNVYTAEISDEFGSFPGQDLETFISEDLSGTIYVTIPSTLTFSSTYQIRVNASQTGILNIAQNGNPSGNIDVNCTTRNYYWTGGAGNWSDLSHWEYTTDDVNFIPATEVPQTTDNVNFDDLSFPSGGQLTMDVVGNCNDFYWEPGSGDNNPVIWSNNNALHVYGDFELASGVYRDLYRLYFQSQKENVYINFGDNLIQKDQSTWWQGYIHFSGSGSWDQDSDLIAAQVQITGGGTLYTNDYQYDLNAEIYQTNGVFYAGSSNIFARGMSMYSTFYAENSNIFLQSYQGSITFINGNNDFNNLTVESGNCNVNGSNTFENFSVINGSDIYLSGGSTQTVNNSFIAEGTRSNMTVINSLSSNIQATIDISGAASVSANFVDITDNNIDDGGGGIYSATNAVNGGNNSNWSFSLLTPLDYYWVGGAGNWSDANHWSTSADGGTTLVSASVGPGTVDNIFFTGSSNPNGASFPAGGTITIDQEVTINNITWESGSGDTNPEIFGDWSYYFTVKGDITMANGVSRRIYRLVLDSGNGVNNVDMADNYNTYGDLFLQGGGSWNLLGDLYVGASLFINEGTLNTNGHTITVNFGFNINSDLSILNFGNSDVYLYDGFFNNATTPTINTATSTFYFGDQNNPTQISGNPVNFGNVVVSNELEIDSDNTFNSLTVNPGGTLRINVGNTQTINSGGTLSLVGTRSNLVSVEAYNTPGAGTLNVTGATVNASFVEIANNTINNGLVTNVIANDGINNGGNTGWTINDIVPLDFYWIGGAGNWTDISHWENPDGIGGFNTATDIPGTPDNVFFTTSSFPSGGTLEMDSEIHINNMTWESGSGGSFPTIYANYDHQVYIHGSIQLADGVNRDIQNLNFESDNTGNTIDLADNIFQWGDIDFEGTGEWNLMSNLGCAYLNIRGGTLNTNDYTIDIIQQMYLDYNSGTVNLGSSEVNLSRFWSNAQLLVFNAQTSTFNFDVTSGTASLGGSYPITFNTVNIKSDANITSSFIFNNLTVDSGTSLELSSGLTQTINNSFTALGTRSEMIEISSNNSGNTSTLLIDTFGGGAVIDVEYVMFEDNILDNGSGFTTIELADNSLDNGNNTGWDFNTNPLTALNYFWIGGTGNWSDINHWATSDGGSTLHSFSPGIIDNVNFTGLSFPSGGEITLDQTASCNDMVWSDGSFNPTIRGQDGNNLIIGGKLTIADGVNRFVEIIEFNSNKLDNPITLNDNRYEYSVFRFEGTGSWSLADALEANALEIYGGTLTTNNQPIKLNDSFYLNGSDPITINLGSSEIETRYLQAYATNVTADVGTSKITLTQNGRVYGSNAGFYDLTIEEDAYIYATVDVANNLTILPGGMLKLQPNKILTVGNLIANGTNPLPVTIMSTTDGQQCTISKASGTVDANHIILKDNFATGGATFNATNAYNKGNNTGWNITEIIGTDYYWMSNTGNWSDKANWSLTDGENIEPATAPGPADNVFVTTNSPIASGGSINLDISAECNNIIWSTGLSQSAISGNNDTPLTVHGSLAMPVGVVNNLDNIYFDTESSGNTIDFGDNAGNQFKNLYFEGVGDWTLQSGVISSSFRVQGGTLNTNGFKLEVNEISLWANTSIPGTLDLTSSEVYVNWMDGGQSGNLIPGTSTIFLDESSIIYDPWTFNNMEVEGEARFYGSNTFNTLTIQPGSEILFQQGGTQTITQFNAIGLRSRPISIKSTQDGIQATLLQSSGVISGEYLILQDNKALGGALFNAQNSIDNGNVNGWNITPISSRNYYWVGGDGNWSDFTNHWSLSDNGTTVTDAAPGSVDNVFFTSNSFPSGGTLTIDFPSVIDNMDWTGSTSNVTISNANNLSNDLTIGGSLTLANGVTRDVYINFDSDKSGNTIFMADNLHTTSRTYFYGSGEWTLTGAYEAERTYMYGGTFNTDNHDFTSRYVFLYQNNVSYWGGSNVVVWRFYNSLDNPNTFNSETSSFKFQETTNNYINGESRFFITTFDGNTWIDDDNIFFNASSTKGFLQLNGNMAFNSLIMEEGTSLYVNGGTTQTFSAALDLNGTTDNPVIVNSFNEGETASFSVPATGTVTATYVHLKDNTAVGGATFNTSNSSNFGNVNGWNGLLTGQTIAFDPLSDISLSSGDFEVSASASSSLDVTYEIAQGNATISGSTVTPGGAGLIGVRAIQAGDGIYGSALPSTRYVFVNATDEPNELGNMKEAKLVLGQASATSSDEFYDNTTVPRTYQVAVSSTGVMAVAHGTRVMIWNEIPDDSTVPADVVIGHTDFTTDISNSTSASTFTSLVYSVAFTHDDKLIATDYGRVLIWNTIPTTNGASADVVIGQDDFTSSNTGTGDNRFGGSVLTANTYFDSNSGNEMLIIGDFNNSRILIFDNIPTNNGASANVVIGQPDFDSNSVGANAEELFRPIHTTVTPDGKLLIADYSNNRVVGFNTIPSSNGAPADFVLGQDDFGSSDSGIGPGRLNSPTSVSVSRTGKLAITDFVNHRVLIYNSVPDDNTTPPDFILGQPDDFSDGANYNSISGRSLSSPFSADWDISENLFVSDRNNNRVLLYGATDIEAPTISDLTTLQPHYTMGATNQTSSATVADRSGIVSAKVHWEEVSLLDSDTPVYEEADLTDLGNGTYQFDLSILESKSSNPIGIEYYVEFIDGLGNVNSGVDNKQVLPVYYPGGQLISNYGVGASTESYRLFSVPLELDDASVNTVFTNIFNGPYDNTKMRIFSYAGGTTTSYNEATGSTNLELGKGYFGLAAAASPSSVNSPPGVTSFASNDNGSGSNIHEYSIPLVNGWNLIGNPFMFDVAWSDIEALSGITSGEVNNLQTYNGAWNTSITGIKAGEGAFVFNDTGGSFTLRIPAKQNTGGRLASKTPNTNSLIETSWEVEFKAIGKNGKKITLGGIGMEPEAEFSKDQFDLLNPPSFSTMKLIEFNHPEFIAPSFKMDVRETAVEEKWSFTYKVENPNKVKHEITWDNSYFGDNTPDLYLVDKTHFTTVNMKEVSSYAFSHGGQTQFEIYFGDNVLELLMPKKFITQSPFPNPFNDEITFNLGLPQSTHYAIEIRIYDAIGKVVRQIKYNDLQAGYASIVWDGHNEDGSKVADGIYTYNIHIRSDAIDTIESGKLLKR